MHITTESKQMVMTRPIRLALPWLVLLGLSAGCPAGQDDVQPPYDEFFFPTGVAVSPDESTLFVVNANSDLRYDSGTVNVIDLERAEELASVWWQEQRELPAGADCVADPALPGVLQCHEREVIDADAGARVGNFATALAVQTLDSGDLRLFVAVRGDPSITWVDYASATGELACGPDQEVPLCDNDHRLLSLRDDPALPDLVGEPFGVLVDSLAGFAMITHLSQGAVSLVDAPTDGRAPLLVDAVRGLFDRDPETNVRGALGVAGRPNALAGMAGQGAFDHIYVTGRTEDRVLMLSVYRAEPERAPIIALGEHFFLNGVDNPVSDSDDSRGIAFNQDGSRLYVINRDPTFLHIYDTEDGPDGFPANEYIGAVELCREPANIAVADLGRGDRAYVSCFASGQIWVIDTRAQTVEAIIDVGRGPHALALTSDTRKRLYVANFLENTVSVVDIEPGSQTENRVLIRLGGRSASGDQ